MRKGIVMIEKNIKKFNPLRVSRKFSICGLPIRVDTYRTCSFKCEYCFANNRIVMAPAKDFQIANINNVKTKLKKIFDKKSFNSENFLDTLISQGYTWHCGGMSDPFQPCEKIYGITRELIEVTKPYNVSILFRTKTDDLYGSWDVISPDIHTFQLSITNVNNNKVEPNVANIEKRYNLYRKLKDNGFRVGIRIQPFIPNITTTEIIDMFYDANHFTIEGIKMVNNNEENKNNILNITGLQRDDFIFLGMMNMKPELRLKLYEPFIKKFESIKASWSIADNDLHYLGNNFCCCGDSLINKGTIFNNTYMCHKYGKNYTKEQIDDAINDVKDCVCKYWFYSREQEGLSTVQDYYDKKFDAKRSIFSPNFLYDVE